MGLMERTNAEAAIREMSDRMEALRGQMFMNVNELSEYCDLGSKIQSLLSPQDPRHEKMFAYTECKTHLLIYWGGYEYPYAMDRFARPEDLMWLVVHLAQKDWEWMTGSRVGRLIESVSRVKGWPAYGHAAHPNEAPSPNHDKIAEREKMTAAMRYAVIKRDAYRCRCCGFAVQDGAHLHVDHIVAVAKGGRTEMGNLQTLCTVCNIGKGAK